MPPSRSGLGRMVRPERSVTARGAALAGRCLGAGRGTGSPGGQVKGRWVVEYMPLTSSGPADYNEGKHCLTVSPALRDDRDS